MTTASMRAGAMHRGGLHVVVLDLQTLARNWWAVALRGVAGILFGLVTLFAPGISLALLVLAFGAYAFVDGVFALVSALRGGTGNRGWTLLVEGVTGIVAGVLTLMWPGITALALLYVIAAWAVVTGVLEIAAAVRLRKEIAGEWLLALGGIASVAFGALLAMFPGAGALVVVLWIGAYALVFGALFVALGFRLRSLRHT